MRRSLNKENLLLRFFKSGPVFFLILLILIIVAALADYHVSGLVRRSFVFYSALEGRIIVEDRVLRKSSSRETDIRRYVDEALLGPVSPEAAPLFNRETDLYSLLYRDGVVFANFCESALIPVFPPAEGVFLSFLTLNDGIRRNFSFVKDLRFFIEGREIFFKDFQEIFAYSADNLIKTGQ